MPRPLRIQYPGAYYQVMNRGNRREDIFITDTDRSRFVDALTDSCETFSVKLIVYVLMANHFHLLVQTAHANLSEFMRHFLVTYTVRFNRRNGRRGHVFQGRFKSLLLEEDEYLLPLSRYIHLNPIRPRRFKNADIQSQSDYLKNYPWSSYPGYSYLRKRGKNIDYGWLLNMNFGEDSELRQMAMELSYRYSDSKQKEIGAIFGVDYSTVSQSRARLKAKLKSSRKLNNQFKHIKDQVINLSISKI